mmetsp:Transcript_30671/g.53824  ORF Transcript_30671/g.53824 Transcript_30671/m.53824 type:complete len:432 (-) Transcript_30671:823-2118(-)
MRHRSSNSKFILSAVVVCLLAANSRALELDTNATTGTARGEQQQGLEQELEQELDLKLNSTDEFYDFFAGYMDGPMTPGVSRSSSNPGVDHTAYNKDTVVLNAKQITLQWYDCVATHVTLGWNTLDPNALMSKKVLEKTEKLLVKEKVLKPREKIHHCYVILRFEGQEDCHRLVMEHGFSIEGMGFRMWLRSKAAFVDNKFGLDATYTISPEFRITSQDPSVYENYDPPRDPNDLKPTMANVMQELFIRDPQVQFYDIQDRNCCFFAKNLMNIMLTDYQMAEAQSHFQDAIEINKRLKKKTVAYGLKKRLVQMMGSSNKIPDFMKLQKYHEHEHVGLHFFDKQLENAVKMHHHRFANVTYYSNNNGEQEQESDSKDVSSSGAEVGHRKIVSLNDDSTRTNNASKKKKQQVVYSDKVKKHEQKPVIIDTLEP